MKHILVVDDSPTESHLMKTYLEKHGYQVSVVTDGSQAVQNARQLKPDLILMDVVMPGINGFQATRALNKDPDVKGTPVIIVSSKSQESDIVWGLRQGATDYVVKPFTESTLINKVTNALLQKGL